MAPGGFVLGLGSGEALNEEVIGTARPPGNTRLAMLDEAIEVMRALWTAVRSLPTVVSTTRCIYTRPENPPPVYVSGLASKAVELAGRIGDGYIAMMPSAELIERFQATGGQGKPKQGGMKVAFASSARAGAQNVARLWPSEGISGELGQVLRTREHIMQAASMVTVEQLQDAVVCGPDPAEHLAGLRAYLDAGFDDVFINQIGPDKAGFFSCYRSEVLPELRQ